MQELVLSFCGDEVKEKQVVRTTPRGMENACSTHWREPVPEQRYMDTRMEPHANHLKMKFTSLTAKGLVNTETVTCVFVVEALQ